MGGKGKAKTEEESHSFTEPEDEPSDLPPSSSKKSKAVTLKSKKSPKNSTPKVVEEIQSPPVSSKGKGKGRKGTKKIEPIQEPPAPEVPEPEIPKAKGKK